ncbi:MAG: transposase zinc-binding domain-containing protein [Saprospiraceae bacterium]|nr:transposase zinc-binding domain-containing protein [Saprospiraceae bacterium]
MTGSTKAYKASKHKVADIINQQWSQIQSDTHFNSYQIRILDAIRKCRTPALGGYLYQCSHCGHVHKRYNSCRNRHCPTCQNTQKEKWILARQASLINTRYYHAVFTIPAELNQFCLAYPRQMYSILFQCAWQTLDSFAWNPKYLGAQIGVTMVLHTWGQNLSLHPHVHCIVPEEVLLQKINGKMLKEMASFCFLSKP